MSLQAIRTIDVGPKGSPDSHRPAGWLEYGVILATLLLCLMTSLASGVLAGTLPGAIDNTGPGYLNAPSIAPGHILRPGLAFMAADPLSPDTQGLGLAAHWGNISACDSNRYMIDGEWVRYDLRYQKALPSRVSVGLSLPFHQRMGGFADSGIESFHRLIGVTESDNSPPHNRSMIMQKDSSGWHTLDSGNSFGPGDTTLFTSWLASEGDALLPAVCLQAGVSLPTGDVDEFRGLGVPCVEAAVELSKQLWRTPSTLFGGMAVSYADIDSTWLPDPYDEVISGLLGLSYRYSPRLSVVVQMLTSSATAREYGEFSDLCYELSGGLKWTANPQTCVEFALQENLFTVNNAADIGMHLGIDWRF